VKRRFVFIAQRLQVSSEQVVRMKDSCSRMREHSAAVCASLRVSAAKNEVNRGRTQTFCPAGHNTQRPLITEEDTMETTRFLHWQDGNMWLGYLEEYPDYMTQGETFDELKENLKDFYKDLTSGAIPCVRKVAELEVA
jgi:hypothetical protein